MDEVVLQPGQPHPNAIVKGCTCPKCQARRNERNRRPFPSKILFTDESDRATLAAKLPAYDHEAGLDCMVRVASWPNENLPVGRIEITGVDLAPLVPEDFLRDRRKFGVRIESKGPYFSGERIRLEIRNRSKSGPGIEAYFSFAPATGP